MIFFLFQHWTVWLYRFFLVVTQICFFFATESFLFFFIFVSSVPWGNCLSLLNGQIWTAKDFCLAKQASKNSSMKIKIGFLFYIFETFDRRPTTVFTLTHVCTHKNHGQPQNWFEIIEMTWWFTRFCCIFFYEAKSLRRPISKSISQNST